MTRGEFICTVIKRNWHLLPYGQLLTMLDMARAELAYSLVEDDFIFSKLGNTKPFCAPVVCNAEIAERGRARRDYDVCPWKTDACAETGGGPVGGIA